MGKKGKKPVHILSPRDCARTGCNEPGIWMPRLNFYTDEKHRFNCMMQTAEPACAEMQDLLVCEEHKNQLELKDIMDDRGWQFMVRSFLKVKRPIPKRNLTELEWILVDKRHR